MKKILLAILLLMPLAMMAQTDPVLSIDGVNTTFKSGLSLPYWLKGGQTVGLVTGVKSASILEFTEDNGNLKYSQTIALTTTQTVPIGKVWKIEGLGLGINGTAISGFSNGSMPTIFTSPKTFSTPGTYTWKVPPGITNICIEVWGAGAGSLASNLGGGGGAYGYQCFTVVPGTDYVVVVGGGGKSSTGLDGGQSSVGNLVFANGGLASTSNTSLGIGGTSNASFNISGTNSSGVYIGSYQGGLGGNPLNGLGNGGCGCGIGIQNGVDGQVIIYW